MKELERRILYTIRQIETLSPVQFTMAVKWITAFHLSVGSVLLEDAIARFQGFDIYLENSNPDKNDHFYHKHGSVRLPEISWHGCVLQPMLRTS